MSTDHYPWINRSPSIGLKEILSSVEPGKNARAIKKLIKRRLRTIMKHASDPIQVEDTPEGRCVTVMGVLKIIVSDDFEVSLQMRQFLRDMQDVNDRRSVPEWYSFFVDYDSSLRFSYHEEAINENPLNPWIFVAQQDYSMLTNTTIPMGREDSETRQWRINDYPAFQWIREWVDEYALRRLAAEALGIDQEIADLCAWVWDRYQTDIGYFFFLIKYRSWFVRLAEDDPRLMPWGYLLIKYEDIDLTLEPVAAIRKQLAGYGLTQGGWRLLLNAPEARTRLDSLFGYRGCMKFLALWLNAHVQLGLKALVHDDYFRDCLQWLGDLAHESNEMSPKVLPPILRILVREAAKMESKGRLGEWRGKHQVSLIRHWMERYPDFVPDTNQRRSGFRWLYRHVEQEKAEWVRIIAKDCTWSYAIQRFEQAGLVAHALQDMHAIWDEGAAMNHCLDVNRADCHWVWYKELLDEGDTRYFSIRDEAGERVATLQIGRSEPGQPWQAEQCLAVHNLPAPMSACQFSKDLAKAYSLAEGYTGEIKDDDFVCGDFTLDLILGW